MSKNGSPKVNVKVNFIINSSREIFDLLSTRIKKVTKFNPDFIHTKLNNK